MDTIVMSNLFYLQLKAAPGVWTLSLAPGQHSGTLKPQTHKPAYPESLLNLVFILSVFQVEAAMEVKIPNISARAEP